MIVKPKIRGFICTTAHPVGCAKHVQNQIDYVKKNVKINNGPKNVLIIGASTGFGLSSRIVSSFGCGAGTIGVFFEKEPDERRTASAGWYNTVAFEQAALKEGRYVKSFNGDAYSDEMKKNVCEQIKKDWGTVDLIIYSLAAPRRTHPKTGKVSKSTLKPREKSYTNKSIDFSDDSIISVTLETATEDDINQTVNVMGGEDWEMWIDALEREGLLSDGASTVAYSYVGPEVTIPVYRNGSIGAAKEHLEKTAKTLDERMKKIDGRALISVNKALVTQSSSAIPFIPLYFVILMKIMKQKGIHEDCIEQMCRLFQENLYSGNDLLLDDEGRIRVDNLEMREDVQAEVKKAWENVSNENVASIADLDGYHENFLRLFGFGLDDVDYDADVDINLSLY